jgi:hypothetical protein
MLPVIVSAGGFRLLAGALPITVLIIFFGLLAGFAMVMPKDRREYVLKLAHTCLLPSGLSRRFLLRVSLMTSDLSQSGIWVAFRARRNCTAGMRSGCSRAVGPRAERRGWPLGHRGMLRRLSPW